MAISHKDHDHPNTPAARAACRKAMANDGAPVKMSAERALAESAGIVKPARIVRVDGLGKAKGRRTTSPRVAAGNLKKPGTVLRTIGDLPDVPRMLAYGARMAWANDWEVKVGNPFNDTEARIVIAGEQAEIALVWRPSLPDGVWGVFVRNWNSSITHRLDSVQDAFAVASDAAVWDRNGNLTR